MFSNTATAVGVAVVGGVLGSLALMGPKKLIFTIMALFRKVRRFWLSLKGSSEQKEIEKKVTSGQAWEEYCDTLKAAGTTLLAPGAPMTPFDQAEGYRYLTRLIRASLTAFLECYDHENPKFNAVANGYQQAPVKLGSDNPDNLYEAAVLNSRYAYRITAKRNTVDFLGFYSQQGVYGQEGGLKTVDAKESQEYVVDKNDMISVLLAPENFENAENFLRMNPEFEEATVIVRQTFKDRSKEQAAEVDIKKVASFQYDEKLKKVGEVKLDDIPKEFDTGHEIDVNDTFSSSDMLSCERIVNALNKSGLFVAGASMMFANWAYGFQKHTNQLPLFDVERSNNVGGDPTIRYYHSYWKLADDEALVIKSKPPKCFTWNFQVNNHWMESLDYRYFRIHVNMASAKYNDDGSVVVILTLKNPKAAVQNENLEYNWLSTTGHNQGTMCWRWIKPESFENLPQPQCTVCKFDQLSSVL